MATISDLPAITDIYNSTVASRKVTADIEEVTVADRMNWFDAHQAQRRPLWVWEDESKKIIGWMSLQDFYGRKAYDGTAEISIYISPESRGKGLGKKLLQYAIKACPSLHVHTLLGFIFAHNNESLQLCVSMGFMEWAHLPRIAKMDDNEYDLKILGYRINQ